MGGRGASAEEGSAISRTELELARVDLDMGLDGVVYIPRTLGAPRKPCRRGGPVQASVLGAPHADQICRVQQVQERKFLD